MNIGDVYKSKAKTVRNGLSYYMIITDVELRGTYTSVYETCVVTTVKVEDDQPSIIARGFQGETPNPDVWELVKDVEQIKTIKLFAL